MIQAQSGPGSSMAWWPRWSGMPFYTGIRGAGAQVNNIFTSIKPVRSGVVPLRDISDSNKIGVGVIVGGGIITMLVMLVAAARSVERNRR